MQSAGFTYGIFRKGDSMKLEDYNDIVQHWMRSVYENRGKDAEQTLKSCNDIINYGVNIGDHYLMGFGYYYRGETYYCLNDGDHFFEAVSKALACLEKAGEWELIAHCYNFLGIWAMNRGNAPVAQDYYLSGLKYCSRYELGQIEVLLYINIGNLNIQCGRYHDAQTYLEHAAEEMKHTERTGDFHIYMLSIYQNLIKALIPQEKTEEIEELFRRIYHEHWNCVDEADHYPVLLAEAIYYHKIGDADRRDHCIQKVQENISQNVAILDMFDDYCEYALMLLEADMDDAFWQLIEIMEPLLRTCNIIKMQLRLISLKIKYYRKHAKSAEYLQASGLYYELSEIMEQETRNMMNNVLNLRRNLEFANRARIEAEQQNRILTERSEMDPLTKIANRFRFNDFSEEIFKKVSAVGQTLTVEILDVDYFKEYNDNYGHQMGDGCLIAVAGVLREMSQKHRAFCARYGGDEFVMIYEGQTYEEAQECARELKEKVLALNLEHLYSKAIPQVTVSQGLCWGMPNKDNRMWDFLHAADDMLYRVKKVSRNNYSVGDLGILNKS